MMQNASSSRMSPEQQSAAMAYLYEDGKSYAPQPETFNVELPNGQILEGIPLGTTKEQIQAKLTAKGITFDEPKPANSDQPQSPSLIDKFNQPLTDIANQTSKIFNNASSQNPASTALQLIGQGASVASLPVTMAASAISSAIPQGVKDYVSDSAVGDVARQYGSKISEVTQANPEMSANLGAAANIAGTLIGGSKVATPVVEKSITAATPVVNKAVDALKPAAKAPITTAGMVKQNASNLFKEASTVGGELKPTFANKFADDVLSLSPQTEQGKILAGDSPFTKMVDKIQQFRDKPVSLQAAQEIDEHLGDAIDAHFTLGKLDKQGQKILELQSRFRNMVENAPVSEIAGGKQGFEALKNARQEWSRAARLSDIERIVARAEQMDNPATGLKNGFRTLYNSPSRMRGFSPEQRFLIKKAAEGTMVGDALRTVGSRLISTMVGAMGGGAGGAAAGYIASTGSRNLAGKLGARQAEKIAGNIINANGGIKKAMNPQALKVAERTKANLPSYKKGLNP